MSYPHVRVSPRQAAAEVTPTERAYADAVDYAAADRMGWDHSAWDSKRVLATSPSKIHASAQWCRYNARGERILPNNVSYVITRVDDRWGIQARFGVDSAEPADPAAVSATATEVLTEALAVIGASGGGRGVEELVRLPFHVIDTGRVATARSVDEVRRELGNAVRGMTVAGTTALQVGEKGVNVGVDLRNAESSLHGLFLVTLEAKPQLAAVSLLPLT